MGIDNFGLLRYHHDADTGHSPAVWSGLKAEVAIRARDEPGLIESRRTERNVCQQKMRRL